MKTFMELMFVLSLVGLIASTFGLLVGSAIAYKMGIVFIITFLLSGGVIEEMEDDSETTDRAGT